MGFSSQKQKGGFFKLLFCLIANFILFGICYYMGLPVRLEHVGTFYAAAAFGLPISVSVAIISQLVYSLFYFGFSNVLFVLPVLIVVYLISCAVRFGWLETIISSLGTMVLAIFIMLVFNLVLFLLLGNSYFKATCWSEIYDTLARYGRYGKFSLLFFTALPYVMLNMTVSWFVSLFSYRLTPKQTTMGIFR